MIFPFGSMPCQLVSGTKSIIQVFGVKDRIGADDALDHRGFEVVCHHICRHAAEGVKGILVAGQKVLHGLGDGTDTSSGCSITP